MKQGQVKARRPKLPGPRPVLPNPEQDAIVRILWRAERPRLASEVFRRVEVCVPGPTRSDVGALATEALQLERRGLLEHGRDRCGLVTLALTTRGRRFVGLRYGDYRRPIAASIVAPVVVACSSVQPSDTGQRSGAARIEQAELPPKPSSVLHFDVVGAARQVVVNGEKTWLWCTSNDCVRPTFKEPAVVTPATPKSSAMPLAAPLPSPVPTPMAAKLPVHSVFFGFAAAAPEKSEEDALVKAVRGVDRSLRVTVVGMTDISGSPALNEQLAQRRAQAIRAMLVKHGFEADRISVQIDTSGATEPPARSSGGDKGASGNARFRRVDISFSTASAAAVKTAATARSGLDSAQAKPSAALQECVRDKTTFKVPAGIRPKMHLARFEVGVGPGGRQTARATMVQSSGLPAFDAAVAAAVERCMAEQVARSVTVPTTLTVEIDLFSLALKNAVAVQRTEPVKAKPRTETRSDSATP